MFLHAVSFQEFEGGNDSPAGASDPRLRAARLDAAHTAVTFSHDGGNVRALRGDVPQILQNGRKRASAHQQPRGVMLRVAAYLQHAKLRLRQRRGEVRPERGLSDSALSVYRDLQPILFQKTPPVRGRGCICRAADNLVFSFQIYYIPDPAHFNAPAPKSTELVPA